MKIKLHSLAFCFVLGILPILSFSQCPTTAIALNSQAEINAFATNYPDCTELLNILAISGNDITDLTPLSIITYTPYLSINDNPLLMQLNGLHNLQSSLPNTTYLNLDNNPLITDLSVFTGLTSLSGLGVRNSSLTNLDGLDFVTDFVLTDFGSLSITSNNLLMDISALSNILNFDICQVSCAFSMYIVNNPVLSSLSGLQGFSGDYDYFHISNNDSLVDLTGLSDDFRVLENFHITDNDLLESFDGIVDVLAHELTITDNPVLDDLSALNNYSGYPPALVITGNSSLSICNNATFCGSISEIFECCEGNHPNFLIENNASGCNSIPEIAFSCDVEPINDECDDAIELSIGETLESYNELTTQSMQTPSCNDNNRLDVWFRVNSESYTSLDVITETDYSLQLWEGDCTSLVQVSNACEMGSLNDIPVTTNTDYYIQVWSDSETGRATGLFDVLVQDATLTTEDFTLVDFALYPNPTGNILNLKSKKKMNSVKVYNLLGQHIFSSTPDALKEEINMTELNSGMYLISIEVDDRSVVYRIIKK